MEFAPLLKQIVDSSPMNCALRRDSQATSYETMRSETFQSTEFASNDVFSDANCLK